MVKSFNHKIIQIDIKRQFKYLGTRILNNFQTPVKNLVLGRVLVRCLFVWIPMLKINLFDKFWLKKPFYSQTCKSLVYTKLV